MADQTIVLTAVDNIESPTPFMVVSGGDAVVFSVAEDIVTFSGSTGSSVFPLDFLDRQRRSYVTDFSSIPQHMLVRGSGEFLFAPYTEEEVIFSPRVVRGSGKFLFAPTVASAGDIFTPFITEGQGLSINSVIPSSFTAYSISSARSFNIPMFDVEEITAPSLSSSLVVDLTSLIPSEFVAITPDTLSVSYLSTDVVPEAFFTYPIRVSAVKSLPLLLKAATVTGAMSPADISSYQSYYSVPSIPDPSLLRVAKVTAGGISYIESKNALSSGVMYSAFYVVNNTSIPNLVRRNIYLSMSGGIGYRAVTPSVPNGITIHEGSQFTTNDDILLGASSRTSLFDQVRISLLLSPSGELYPFNPDGSSAYFDLRNRAFSPANSRLRVPDLAPGDYYGVYMKVETAFSPDDIKTKDYSFVNLSYVNDYGSYKTRESYPGQVETITGVKTNSALPSIYFEFYSEYQSMVTEISASVERLYSKYPPYFLHYEDLDE